MIIICSNLRTYYFRKKLLKNAKTCFKTKKKLESFLNPAWELHPLVLAIGGYVFCPDLYVITPTLLVAITARLIVTDIMFDSYR